MVRFGWLLWLWCCAARPTSWAAWPGWYINGVHPDGVFEVRPVLGRAAADLEDARARRQIADDRRAVGRVYCAGGATPRQNGLRVWCQR